MRGLAFSVGRELGWAGGGGGVGKRIGWVQRWEETSCSFPLRMEVEMGKIFWRAIHAI